MEPGYGKCRHQVINVFLSDKFKYILWIGIGGKCPGIKQAFFYIFGDTDIAPMKSFVHETAIGYDIGGKNYASLFCYTNRLAQ